MGNMKLPDRWKVEKLGSFTEIKSGGTPSRSNNKFWNNGYIPWLKISDLKSKYISKSEEKVTTFAIESSSAKVFKKGTILYTIFATLGEVAILDIDASTNQAIVGININRQDVDKEYLYYFLKSIKEDICGKGRGVAQNNINMSILKDIEVLLPPLEIQKKIVEILEKAEKALEKRKEANRLLDELVKSQFVEMFGDPFNNPKKWALKSFDEVFDIASSSRILKSEWKTEGSIPFYRVRDMVRLSEDGIADNEFFVSEEFYERVSNEKGVPQVGDIMISATSTIGKCYIVKEGEKFYYKDADVLRFRKTIELSSDYFVHFMKTSFAMNQIRSTFGVTTVPHFTIVNAKKINMLYPPIELQNQFSDFVKQVDKLKFEMQKSLEEMENNFNSLMQRAFKGELFN